uniref:AlNc14C1937G13107 protein n=1 Tax=Albugo laibachii Nc14 TaxID=890382 RepID=F0X2V4_9STRA|nr:AlNc14C1937G13107 [Albugo laibachii Nc14]|eukprot:CCA28274.1 AlNc14C1937G13107 [Albugo laibachii Nc14]
MYNLHERSLTLPPSLNTQIVNIAPRLKLDKGFLYGVDIFCQWFAQSIDCWLDDAQRHDQDTPRVHTSDVRKENVVRGSA